MSTISLHLLQSSSAHTLTDRQAASDISFALGRTPDVACFTEVQERHAQLKVACRAMGYQLVLPSRGDVAIAVRSIHTVTDHSEVAGTPAVGHGTGHPAHTARPILSATMLPWGTSERVTVSTAHWVTKRADTGHQQLELAQDMATTVALSAAGHRLGFWAGDTNNNDRPHDITAVDRALAKGELTSCWDELGRWPATHGAATLDVIGSYDPDRRVTCLRARVWPQLESDHRPVSAWYRIRPVRAQQER